MAAKTESSQPRATDRLGVLAAGHWILDHGCLVESWPEQDTVALISEENSGNGGGAYNLLVDLSRLQCGFPLLAAGLIGDDPDGRAILKDCATHGIDSTGISVTCEAPTSYCYVITATDTGRRTFFHQKGANRHFASDHINLHVSSARIFYLGYLGMLEKMDQLDENQLTAASHIFRQASELGMMTVADLCSNARNDLPSVIGPSLPFLDYLFLNEYEANQLAGDVGKPVSHPDAEFLTALGEKILSRGVRKGVVLHIPDGVVCVQRNGPTLIQGSVDVPATVIRGTAGAGDALAAGFVLGLHEGWPIEQCLRSAVSVAAASLQDTSCSGSIRSWKTCMAQADAMGFRKFN